MCIPLNGFPFSFLMSHQGRPHDTLWFQPTWTTSATAQPMSSLPSRVISKAWTRTTSWMDAIPEPFNCNLFKCSQLNLNGKNPIGRVANSCTLPDCAWSAGLVQSKNLSSKKASRWKSPRIERPIGAWETASFYRKLTCQAGDNCPTVITKVFMKDTRIIALNVYQVDFKSSESNWIDILDHKLSTFFTAWTSQPPHPIAVTAVTVMTLQNLAATQETVRSCLPWRAPGGSWGHFLAGIFVRDILAWRFHLSLLLNSMQRSC